MFLVNIPVGLVALVLAKRVLIESRAPGRRRVPDLLGGLLLALTIASLVLGVVKGQEWGWDGGRVIGAFAGALVLGAWFILRSSRHRTPVVDLSLLRVRAFAISNGVTVVMAAGFYSYTLCNVLFLTGVWRYSILRAGLALMPGPFTAMAVAGPAGRLVERHGHRAVIVPGALIWAAGMAFFATQVGTGRDFPGHLAPGPSDPGRGRWPELPHAQRRRRRLGPRHPLCRCHFTELGRPPDRRGARHRDPDRDPRPPRSPRPAAALPPRLAVRRRLLPVREHRHLGLLVQRLSEAPGTPLAAGGPAADEDGAGPPGPAPARPSLYESEGEEHEPEPQTTAEFLRNVELFSGLTPELLEEVAALAETVGLARGEWLFRQDEQADGVYIVALGHLEVLQDDNDGHEQINTLTRGAVLGELALLSESTRSASVRALRDSQLLRIGKSAFAALLRSEPELALSLTRILPAQLQASRAVPVASRARPVTIALHGLAGRPRPARAGRQAQLGALQPAAVWRSCTRAPRRAGRASRRARRAPAGFAPLIERCESENEHLLMLCGLGEGTEAWDEFCLARADRVLLAADVSAPLEQHAAALERLHGADLMAFGSEPGAGRLARWVEALDPPALHAIGTATRGADIARSARRLSGRAVGAVLAGGGARAFAHLGALEVLGPGGAGRRPRRRRRHGCRSSAPMLASGFRFGRHGRLLFCGVGQAQPDQRLHGAAARP